MSNTQDKTGAQRRRGKVLEAAILKAVLDELALVGYRNLTFDRIAERAGTSKPVLYRRWASKPEIVIAAQREYKPMMSGETPNTGSLRSDVLALLDRVSGNLRLLDRGTLWGLMSEIIEDTKQADYIYSQILQTSTTAMTNILKQAEDRGEVNTEGIPTRLVTLPLDLARHEMLITGKPPTKDAIIEIVDCWEWALKGYFCKPDAWDKKR
jgi:AcrR family transcriptional regulator